MSTGIRPHWLPGKTRFPAASPPRGAIFPALNPPRRYVTESSGWGAWYEGALCFGLVDKPNTGSKGAKWLQTNSRSLLGLSAKADIESSRVAVTIGKRAHNLYPALGYLRH